MIANLVINLDRSPDRLAEVRDQFSHAYGSAAFTRVPGVDGKSLGPVFPSWFDAPAFASSTGRRPLPGDLGCYRSHVLAWSAVAAGEAPVGAIFEDDIELLPGFAEDLGRIAAFIADQGEGVPLVVKLYSRRVKGFVASHRLEGGLTLGRCLLGPTASAAGYALNRPAAAQLVQRLERMEIPVDHALEREWHHGVNVLCLSRPILRLASSSGSSTIGGRSDFSALKFSPLRRLPCRAFRAAEFARRAWTVMSAAGGLRPMLKPIRK